MKRILLLVLTACFFSACNINPSVMFKTPKHYDYFVDQTIGNTEYRIAPNDIIGFSVYTNDGFKLVDLTTSIAATVGTSVAGAGNLTTQFLVEPDGNVKLPIIGKIKVSGLTVRETEKLLETQYATFYNKPFVMLKVMNRRVVVFTGSGGHGTVVHLENENTTIIEALALAGGITETGKAYKIKLVRGDLRNPKVMLINLSTVEGVKQSNMLMQANDIIYVEPVPRISQEVLSRLTPIVGIITSLALLYNIGKGF